MIWQILKTTVTRQRPSITKSAETYFNPIETWTGSQQTIQCTIQERTKTHGLWQNVPEGVTRQEYSILYCNFVTTPTSGLTTDIQVGDRIVWTTGTQGTNYRVIEVANDGGVGDHIKCLLETMPGAPGSGD